MHTLRIKVSNFCVSKKLNKCTVRTRHFVTLRFCHNN